MRTRKPVSSMCSSPAPSAAGSASSATRRTDAQQRGQAQSASSLEALLRENGWSHQPPIAAWQGEGSAGFTQRIAANYYSWPQQQQQQQHQTAAALQYQTDADRNSYPYATSISLSKSSMAPSQSQAPPPQLHHHHHHHHHHRAPSTAGASAPPYAPSSCGGPPSLVPDDCTSCPDSSVDTEYGKLVQEGGMRLLEPDADGVLTRPQPGAPPVYECAFHFLGCRFHTRNEADWRLHSLSHFHGHPPPRAVTCPLCDWGFDDGSSSSTPSPSSPSSPSPASASASATTTAAATAEAAAAAAWDARMSHLAAHVRVGESLTTSRPDFKLFRYLWQKRIVDDAEYKDLKSRGSLAAPRSGLDGPTHTTEGRHTDERRRRIPPHPRYRLQ